MWKVIPIFLMCINTATGTLEIKPSVRSLPNAVCQISLKIDQGNYHATCHFPGGYFGKDCAFWENNPQADIGVSLSNVFNFNTVFNGLRRHIGLSDKLAGNTEVYQITRPAQVTNAITCVLKGTNGSVEFFLNADTSQAVVGDKVCGRLAMFISLLRPST